jgi:hypothetical protein
MKQDQILSWQEMRERLTVIFPDGTSQRGYVVRDLAAKTIFAAIYIDAIEGNGQWLAPKHVYRMSDIQASLTSRLSRNAYAVNVMKPKGRSEGQQWYEDTSREPIRDETLREGLITLGAALEKAGLPTTSGKPRYALRAAFAALFDPALTGARLAEAIKQWRAAALSKGALARIAIVRSGAASGGNYVNVSIPNGSALRLSPGPSSDIAKAVIEVFAPKFLTDPAVLFVSESGRKVLEHHDALARQIGLEIKSAENLPDIVLVDLGPEHPLLVFVEVVATDGPVNARRKAALRELAVAGGFPEQHIAYVTAYLDRGAVPFRKTVGLLAWGTYAWFASEPDFIMELADQPKNIH